MEPLQKSSKMGMDIPAIAMLTLPEVFPRPNRFPSIRCTTSMRTSKKNKMDGSPPEKFQNNKKTWRFHHLSIFPLENLWCLLIGGRFTEYFYKGVIRLDLFFGGPIYGKCHVKDFPQRMMHQVWVGFISNGPLHVSGCNYNEVSLWFFRGSTPPIKVWSSRRKSIKLP